MVSVVLSLLAGFTTTSMSTHDEMKPLAVLTVVLVVIGILAEIDSWSLIPVWYHIVFILLLTPAIIAGGKLAMGRKLRRALA